MSLSPSVAEEAAKIPALTSNTFQGDERGRIQAYLDNFYLPTDVRHSFRTRFAEDIDCIDFRAQLSVRQLVAKGLPVPEAPPVGPPSLPGSPSAHTGLDAAFAGESDDNGNARRCPDGSVPYLRRTVDQIMAAGGLDSYLHQGRAHRLPKAPAPGAAECGSFPVGPGYNWVFGSQPNVTYFGGMTIMSVYNPVPDQTGQCGVTGISGVPSGCEHSLAQIWTTTGTCEINGCTTGANGNAVQSVEVGWDVDPTPGNFSTNGDTNTHLFVFATNDGYTSDECYATGSNCNFVVASGASYTPGQIISGIVAVGSAPLEYGVQTFNPGQQYPQYANWYVYVNGTLLGSYPGSYYYGQMKTSATSYEIGGEVYNNDSLVTSEYSSSNHLPMGTGLISTYGYKYAGYHRSALFIEASSYGSSSICNAGYCYYPPSLSMGACGYNPSPTFPYTYYQQSPGPTINQPWGNYPWGTFFYFGGGGA